MTGVLTRSFPVYATRCCQPSSSSLVYQVPDVFARRLEHSKAAMIASFRHADKLWLASFEESAELYDTSFTSAHHIHTLPLIAPS